MSELKNIHQRLLAVMGEVDYVQKEAKKEKMMYSFVSHDAVTAKVRPVLVKHGVLVVPTVVESSQDGNRTYANIQVAFINVDAPEDKIVVNYFGYGIDTQDKGPGKAVSYAVKYAYLKVLGLETGDDPERDNLEYKEAPPQTSAIPGEQIKLTEHAKQKEAYICEIKKSRLISDLKESFDKAKLYGAQTNDKLFLSTITKLKDELKLKLEGEPNEPFSK